MHIEKKFYEHDLDDSHGVTLDVTLSSFQGQPGCSTWLVTVDNVARAAYLGSRDTTELMSSMFSHCIASQTLEDIPVALRQAMIGSLYASLPRDKRPDLRPGEAQIVQEAE